MMVIVCRTLDPDPVFSKWLDDTEKYKSCEKKEDISDILSGLGLFLRFRSEYGYYTYPYPVILNPDPKRLCVERGFGSDNLLPPF